MKARGDAKLKSLPEGKQEELWKFLFSNNYKKAVGWCKDSFGIETSISALSEFYSWYPVSRQLEEAKSMADQVKETLAQFPDLHVSEEGINLAAQAVFETQAIKTKDVKAFVHLRKLRQRDRILNHDDRRIKLLEAKAAQADEAERVVKSELTDAEKQERMRQIFGMT